MQNQRSALVYEAVERETARKGYPEAFPALPEVPTGRYTDPQFYDLEMRHEEIDRQIGPENIPAHLRIKPVLAHHVSN
jgi:hypothetical protein